MNQTDPFSLINSTSYHLGTGLLSILGLSKFKEVFGMAYKNPCYNCLAPGLSVVFVIDDTGSMSEEIGSATKVSVDIVNQASLLGPNGPSNYILSTFNDPGIAEKQFTKKTVSSLYLFLSQSLIRFHQRKTRSFCSIITLSLICCFMGYFVFTLKVD